MSPPLDFDTSRADLRSTSFSLPEQIVRRLEEISEATIYSRVQLVIAACQSLVEVHEAGEQIRCDAAREDLETVSVTISPQLMDRLDEISKATRYSRNRLVSEGCKMLIEMYDENQAEKAAAKAAPAAKPKKPAKK